MAVLSVITRHWRLSCLSCAAGLALLAVLSLTQGAVPTPLTELWQWLMGEASPDTAMILQHLRLPRVLLAGLIGAALAISGAISQGLFRNPLADPSLIGVSAGASAGASLMIVALGAYHWQLWEISLVSCGAFCGAMGAVFIVYRLATGPMGTSVSTMLLAGIAISFVAGSLSSVLEFVADNDMLRRMSLWRMGALDAANYPKVLTLLAVLLPLCVVLPRFAPALNVLLLGESEARHLGINVQRTKWVLIVWVAAAVGTAVAVAGTIAFIGLLVPHMVRLAVGPNHHYVLPLSGVCGAALLMVADALARTVVAPTELPVGLATALLGAPVFISLLRRRHQYGMREL